MPELPEVETTRRGISPHILNRTVTAVTVRQGALRWPVPADLARRLRGMQITAVERRGKYLLLTVGPETSSGQALRLLIHLGMSGSLRLVAEAEPAAKHDHVDIVFDHGQKLRYTDPRRFGCLLWCEGDPASHPLLCHLGPEPLSEAFGPDYLFEHSRKRSMPVKSFIMDSQVLVGVGNIYANEALFLSGIHPSRHAGRISAARYRELSSNIRLTLQNAINQGGTTLRDFVGGDGKPGYFRQSLHVYGRKGLPCTRCQTTLKEIRLGQRSTVFCPRCQR